MKYLPNEEWFHINMKEKNSANVCVDSGENLIDVMNAVTIQANHAGREVEKMFLSGPDLITCIFL